MSLYEDLPENLQALIDNPIFFNFLAKLEFNPRSSVMNTFPHEFQKFQSSTMQFLAIKYHGMGHYQIVMVDPTRKERKFYLLVIGGSDDWQRKSNIDKLSQLKEENFCDLIDLFLYAYGTHEAPIYVNLEEAKKRCNKT